MSGTQDRSPLWGRRRYGRQQFGTRNEGHGRSKKRWICIRCRTWHETKPKVCANACGAKHRDMLYFPSEGQAQRFMQLWMLQEAGQISDLQHHPRFELCVYTADHRAVKFAEYEADASYKERGEYVVEDYKPRSDQAQDPVFLIKRRAFEAQYGITLRIVK